MRALDIIEDDELLFGNELGPDHFKFYLQHKDAFKRMWKEQGTGFWLRFLISLRSFMKQQTKFVINVDDETVKKKIVRGCEDAYCKILDDLTAPSCSALKNLIVNVATVAENKHNLVNIAQKSVANDPFYSKISRTAFRDLFGDPTSKETFVTMCDKMMVFLHAAGSLCVLLKRWTVSKDDETHIKNIPWKPPATWNTVACLDVFEIHLRRKFGNKLCELLGVENYSWVAELGAAEAEFKKKVVDQMSSVTKKLLPWKPLDKEWTQKILTSPDICLHLTKLVWSTYFLSLSDITASWLTGEDVFSDNQREQCAVQIGVSMYHHIFGPNFFAFLLKNINTLKNHLDDETLKELDHISWSGKKLALSKTKWNDLIQSHQLLEKIVPVFRNKTEDIINFIDNSEFCSFPALDKDVTLMLTAWNLPLAKDYLDHALCWIAYFEELVAPLVVFPLLKELQQPLERLMVVFRQGKFYAQVCMEYVNELDRLYGTSDFNWLSAVEYHETIQDLLTKLWLDDWLYATFKNMQEILNIAWSKQELKDGITSNPNRHRIFAKFLNLEAYPSVENLFCDNPRHFAYWIPTIPELDSQKNNFKEVRSIWKEFCSKIEKGKYNNWNTKVKEWGSINKELTSEENIMFERMNWKPASLQDTIDDIKEALVMINEDENITDDIVSKMNVWLKSIVLLNKSNKSSPVLEKMMDNLKLLHKHGCLYMLGKSAILATEKIDTSKRAIFVLQLLQQCKKQIAVSSSKFACLAQVLVTESEKTVPCPTKKWLDKITSFCNDYLSASTTGNLKLINSNLEKLCKQFWDKKLVDVDEDDEKTNRDSATDSNSMKEINSQDDDSKNKLNSQTEIDMISKTNGQEAESSKTKINSSLWPDGSKSSLKTTQDGLDSTSKIINLKDSNPSKLNSQEDEKSSNKTSQVDSDEENWDGCHDELYVKWQELFKKVVTNYYQLSAAYHQQGGVVIHKQFPHWHTLLFFMREEIGYSGAYLDYGDWNSATDDIEEPFKKKLMEYRLSWMEEEIEKWCADSLPEKGNMQLPYSPADSAALMHQHAVARVRLLFSDIIIKSCIAKTLGISISAFVNIRSPTIDLVNDWSFFMLNLVANDPAFWVDMSVLMVNCTAYLEIFSEYSETYMHHITEITGGNFLENWDLDKPFVPDSVEHYRVAILALLRFNLVNFYTFITMELPLLANLHVDDFINVFVAITKFFLCVVSDDFMYIVMPGGMTEAKTKLQSIWQETKALQPPTKRDVQILSSLPEFVIGDTSWKALMENFVNCRYDAVTAKLALTNTKSTTNQPLTAPKNVNKNKKKQPVIKFENKGEIKGNMGKNDMTMSVVQWDDSRKDLVVKSFTISHTCNMVSENGSSSDTACRNQAAQKVEHPSGDTSVNIIAGKGNIKDQGKDGKKPAAKGIPANLKRVLSNEKKTVNPKDTSTLVEETRNLETSVDSGKNGVPDNDLKTYSATDEIDGSKSQSKTSVKVKALHSCAYCKSVEPSPRVYMKCALCKQHNFRPPMFYCGQECHAKHWSEGHGEQHAVFSGTNKN